jgi:membrane protein DedA with SNARE-associated domain
MGALADNPHHRPHRLATLLGVVAVLLVMSNVGSILAPTLVNDHPVLLLALSARNRHLLFAVGAGIDPLPYVVVSALRLTAAAIPFFLLGRWYGDSGLRWLEKQAGGTPASIRWVESGFRKAGEIVLFFMVGSNLVLLLAGSSTKSVKRCAIVFALGVAARLGFFWVMGKAFEDVLKDILDWIQKYQWWLVIGFFALTVVQSFRRAASTSEEEPPHESGEEAPVGDGEEPPHDDSEDASDEAR